MRAMQLLPDLSHFQTHCHLDIGVAHKVLAARPLIEVLGLSALLRLT